MVHQLLSCPQAAKYVTKCKYLTSSKSNTCNVNLWEDRFGAYVYLTFFVELPLSTQHVPHAMRSGSEGVDKFCIILNII